VAALDISLNILIEHLQGYGARLSGNANKSMRFSTVKHFFAGQQPQPGILYIATEEEMDAFCASPDGDPFAVPLLFLCKEHHGKCNIWLGKASVIVFVDADTELNQVFNSIQDLISSLSIWEAKLNKVIFTEKTFQPIIDVANELLHLPLLIWGANYNILAHSHAHLFKSDDIKNVLEQGFIPEQAVKFLREKNIDSSENADGIVGITEKTKHSTNYIFLCTLLTRNGKHPYTIALISERENISNAKLDLLDYLCKKMREYLNYYNPADSNDSIFEGFLRNMIDGTLADKEDIKSRANLYGLDINKSYLFYLIEFEQFSLIKAQFFAEMLRNVFNPDPIIIHGEYLIMLKTSSAAYCKIRANKQSFQRSLENYGAKCGISIQIDSLLECPKAYQQAYAALQLGNMWFDPKTEFSRIFLYEKYAVFHMLQNFEASGNDILKLLPNKFVPLLEEKQHWKDTDLQFIQAFFNNKMSTTATASCLSVHRNTVVNRLNRFKEQYGLDLESAESLFNILLVLKIAEYREKHTD